MLLVHLRVNRMPLSTEQQAVTALVALLLLQQVELLMCHHLAASKRSSLDGISNSLEKRGSHISSVNQNDRPGRGTDAGQLEQIFNVGDQMESNYDEYPMVVPKRTSLRIDRLMGALHRALEKEHNGHQDISDLYNDKNAEKHKPNVDELEEDSALDHMYSEDDPSVMMDYDFKDLNSINRATGETLTTKSFQRRNIGNMNGVQAVSRRKMKTVSAGDDTGGNGGGGGSSGIRNSGRTYWRCYFNAVSCF